jgi:hypothetical protein
MPKARVAAEVEAAVALAEEAVALVEQGVARAEQAAELAEAPVVRVPEVVVRVAPARVVQPAELVLVLVVRAAPARVGQPAERVRVVVPALRVPLVQPAARAAPVLAAQAPVELVQAQPVPAQPERLAVVPAPRGQERVPGQVLAVAAPAVAQAAERVALKSLRRSCAARGRCTPPPRRMYLSRCGLSGASATTLVNRAALSSKPS